MYKTTLKIDGMMCGMCESHMNDLIRKNHDVVKVKSSVKKGNTIIFSEEPLDRNTLQNEIENIGYQLIDVQSEIYEKKRGLFFNRG